MAVVGKPDVDKVPLETLFTFELDSRLCEAALELSALSVLGRLIWKMKSS